ncbi:phage terminase large subunit [Ancylobacter rudongensis]|uniref:Terminase-like family protein n=1 Tax=Ancylobacter rudongensis TaxID=177413 RepID=A0A1G4URP4_9HYPH|nr:phage terminase large subunit [Ancylobacter rudongensis]SCW95625.1 Terminase-like family protein [Ancylobacter rudongensis]
MRSGLSLKLHKLQKLVLRDPRRFRVIVAGRRWGKTQLSKISLIRFATEKQKQLVWYVAPTYQMARDILWDDLKASIPAQWVLKIHETRMVIWLINGSRIHLKGADKPDTLRGVGLNFLVMDEAQDVKQETWELVLRPTLASTGGRALFIATPKNFNWLHAIYVLGQRGAIVEDERGRRVPNDWKSWQFPTITSPFIPKSEIRQARRDMDPRSFRQEFEASFETMSGRVYYPFERGEHVGDYPYNPALPIYVGMDFNIDPMSMIIIQEQHNGEIWVVDEAVLPGSNTQEAADELGRRYWKRMNALSIYPDPAGNNRNHDRGESSLDILREAGFRNIYYKRKHPLVMDRVNAVNRLLRTAEGQVRLRVDRKCRKFIDSLEQTIYKEGSREVDKSKGTEHAADAFGYYADFRHPVIKPKILGISL